MNNETELLTVIRDINSPPGGWKYTPPQTGITITSSHYSSLKDKVIRHLRANRVEVDEAVIEDGACRETENLPAGWCRKREPKPVAGMPVPLLSGVEMFLKSVWGTLKGRQFVHLEEAERRAAICRECPYRVDSPGGCVSCFSLIKAANNLIDRNPIKFEADADGTVRDTCKACLCVCHIKVWVPSAVLDKAEGEKRPNFHPSCWRLEN